MPRITLAHEHAVRTRIVEAALRVFAREGYHGATIQDVVRESGLSVGAIYTYFRGKEDLFLATCDLSDGPWMAELGDRVVRGRSVAEKLVIAIGFFLDSIDGGKPDMASVLVLQWARAEAEGAVRDMLVRRRDQIIASAQLLVREGIATGELPAWTDPLALTAAWTLFLDGLLLWRLELGDDYRRDEAERRANALLEPLLAAAGTANRPTVPEVQPKPWSLLQGPSTPG